MSRLDWKRGRFDATEETNQILSGIEGHREVFGDWLFYYRFNASKSQMNEIYDEPEGLGRVYDEPLRLPCIHVNHVEGESQWGDQGQYYNDSLMATVSYEHFVNTGMDKADIDTAAYQSDRIRYDNKIFRILQIRIEGQIQRRDIIVAIDATQLKPDELVMEPQFKRWSA